MARTSSGELRRQLAIVFEDEEPRSTVTRAFNLALGLLIVTKVSCVVLESVEPIRRHFAVEFDTFEEAATAIFAAEYVLRAWACVDYHDGRYGDPLWGRLRYLRSFFALVDLFSVLPAILSFMGAGDLRVLRLPRLLRMLKLIRHSTTFGLLFSVLREEAQSITALLFVLLLTVTISGSLMFMLEGAEQPAVFTSIPSAMWWAIETLTTVGYGDMVPVTAAGRILGGVVSIIGIRTLALFSGLITVGFLDQLKIYREQHAKVSVAVSEKTISITQSFRERVSDGRELTDLPAVTSDRGQHRGQTGSGLPGICPHCGSVFSSAVIRRDVRDEPFGA
ncbi:MAG TPA: ion transporter [Xanthobacteraceae bacterium]|nr:ion transporter [Xanthobacteraceae bacterium]